MKWKLSTNALLATVVGTCALTPIRSIAQQLPLTAPDASPSPASQPATAAASPDPFAILNGTAPGISQPQRDEAAERLLSRHTAQARQILHDALVSPDEGGQLAVARALDLDPNPDPLFIDALYPLLENREVAAAAGRALAGYKANPDVLGHLIDRATARRNAAEFTRLAAIRAIGTIPEKRGAAVLMQLLVSPDELPTIHKTAAEALTNLTGLEQNGDDAARWRKWWEQERGKPEGQFRTEIEAMQDARLDRMNERFRGLVDVVETLLREEYHKAPQAQRQELMLTFLNSPEAQVRQIGTRLLSDDVLEGAALTPDELKRLRDMIADSDPGVRRAVAEAISKINDPAALKPLLDQLKIEPDPTVRTAIATALGPIHDLGAVQTLIKLLSDDSLPTAEAAARALGDLAHGPLPGNPPLAHLTAEALKDTILKRSQTPGGEDLRAACIEALAPLQQTDIIQELLDHKLMDPGKEDSKDVRRAMLMAVGELNNPKFADLIVASLDDEAPEVQVQAIDSLSKNPAAAGYAGNVGALLKPDPTRTQAVRDEAWKFMQDVFPRLSEQQLAIWQDALKDRPDRQLLALEALADKQLANKELEDLATTRTEIGGAYKALKQYGGAAASYRAALDIYNGLPPLPNAQALLQSLISDYMDALLQDEKYPEAIALAADRIRRDPTEQGPMGVAIANKADELTQSGQRDNLLKAKQLIDLASKMTPKLDSRYQARLDADAQTINKKN